jgi:hypothetical protein
MSEQETGYAGRPLPPPASDADVIVAIRHELWQASQGRGFGEDRTLVAMVRRVITERDEAREHRKGEFELRIAAEQRLAEVEAERDKLETQVESRDESIAVAKRLYDALKAEQERLRAALREALQDDD